MATKTTLPEAFATAMSLNMQERRELERWLHLSNRAELKLTPKSIRAESAEGIGVTFGTRPRAPWADVQEKQA